MPRKVFLGGPTPVTPEFFTRTVEHEELVVPVIAGTTALAPIAAPPPRRERPDVFGPDVLQDLRSQAHESSSQRQDQQSRKELSARGASQGVNSYYSLGSFETCASESAWSASGLKDTVPERPYHSNL